MVQKPCACFRKCSIFTRSHSTVSLLAVDLPALRSCTVAAFCLSLFAHNLNYAGMLSASRTPPPSFRCCVLFCYLQSTSLWGIYSHNTNRFSTTTITRSHTRAYFIQAFSIGQAYYILFVPEVPMSIIINVFVFVISLSPFSMSVCLSVCLCLSAYALSMRLNICRFFALHDTIHVY